jgi:uncharacterized membrane protein YdbT with pleckstrin-like domain
MDILILMQVTPKEISSLLHRIHLFDQLNPEQLSSLVKSIFVYEYKPGDYIYRENASAENFFIIYQGQVSIDIESLSAPKQLWVLSEDDYFGEDVLTEEHLRRTDAKASKQTVLLAISRSELFFILEENIHLLPSFRLIRNSYEKLIRQVPSWIKPEEATRFISRPSPSYLFIHSLLPIILIAITLFLGIWFYFQTDLSVLILFPLAAAFIIFGAAWLVWNLVDWSNDYFLVTKRRVIFLEKVLLLYESRQETPLAAILSISKQTSLIGRLFGFSNIAIRTYTGVLYFRHISLPDHVIRLLTEQWERAKKQLSMEDREEMEILLREKMISADPHPEPEIPTDDFSGRTTIKSGWLIGILASIFGMRTEDEAVITYRTHWFILMQKIVMPSFFLVIVFVFLSFLSGFLSAEGMTNPLVLLTSGLLIGATLWWIYQFIDWRNDCYLITKDSLVDINRKPLGLEDRRTAPIKNIQTVEYKRNGFLGILLNFGTVFIRIGDTEFTFDNVHNPSQVQKEIFDRYNTLISLEKKNQLQAERKRMAAWMEAYHHVIMEREEREE